LDPTRCLYYFALPEMRHPILTRSVNEAMV
jgi:hypothetical protein